MKVNKEETKIKVKSEKNSPIKRFFAKIKNYKWGEAYSFKKQKVLYITSLVIIIAGITLALLVGYNIGLNSQRTADDVIGGSITVTPAVKRMFTGEIKEVANNRITVTDLKGVDTDLYFSSTIIIVNNHNERITLTDLQPGRRVVITYTEDDAKQKNIVRIRVY